MDTAALTRKRYHLGEIVGLCRQGGLDVLFASYITSFGFPLLLILKCAYFLKTRLLGLKSGARAADMQPLGPIVNEFLYFLAATENAMISRNLSMPLGTTLICVAKKPT